MSLQHLKLNISERNFTISFHQHSYPLLPCSSFVKSPTSQKRASLPSPRPQDHLMLSRSDPHQINFQAYQICFLTGSRRCPLLIPRCFNSGPYPPLDYDNRPLGSFTPLHPSLHISTERNHTHTHTPAFGIKSSLRREANKVLCELAPLAGSPASTPTSSLHTAAAHHTSVPTGSFMTPHPFPPQGPLNFRIPFSGGLNFGLS